ncbi:MAG: EAL domain-containing protein, partial [Solirubrobacterales bacterium]
IIYLAHSFGLDVIAEGIEYQAQIRRLVELGCTKGQGFHLSLPLSGEAIRELIAARTGDPDAVASAESSPF